MSIVIPAFNAARFIGAAVESALAQTFAPREVIVIDDGSTDDTVAQLADFGERVNVLRQKNAGAAVARNAGIRAAQGEWLAFLDSDDTWERDHIERLVARTAEMPAAHLVYGGRTWVDENGAPLACVGKVGAFPSGWIFPDLFEGCVIGTCSAVLARRVTLASLGGFDEDKIFRTVQDYVLWLRLAARYSIAAAPDVKVRYRRHASNLTNDLVSYTVGELEALRCGERLLIDHLVDPENHPERIDTRARMRRAYTESVVDLFNAGHFGIARSVGAEALRRGLATPAAVLRAALSLAPAGALRAAQRFWRAHAGPGTPQPQPPNR